MEFTLQKAILIGVGIMVALVIVSAVMFVYNQIIDIYTTVEKVDVRIVNIDNEFARYDSNEVRGVEVLNAIKKYKNNKGNMTITFNISGSGSRIILDKNNDWNTYIEYFNGGNPSYVTALSYTYIAKYTNNQGNIKIDFTLK